MTHFCANCEALREMDVHGRCENCGSGALDIPVRPCVTAEGLASAYHIEVTDEIERGLLDLTFSARKYRL